MTETIEEKCIAKGVKLTDQRKVIAQVMSQSTDHPDVDELYNRVSKIDPKISIATVYRTVKLFEEAGILTKHDFKTGKARYELNDDHNNLIDSKTGEIIDLGVEHEIIEKSGSWFSYGGTKLGQGRDSVKLLLKDNPELMEELEGKIFQIINDNK